MSLRASESRPWRWVDRILRWSLLIVGVGFVVGAATADPLNRLHTGMLVTTPELASRLLAIVSLAFMGAFALGIFGFGDLRKADSLLFLPGAVALLIRQLLVRHSNSEITTYFPVDSFASAWPFTDKHSITFGAVKALLVSASDGSHEAFMNLNGVVGALAAVAAGLFIARRFASLEAGLFAALLFAVQPLLARYAPTDAQISFLLFWWFAGLALLSSENIRARELFGGLCALGLAGTMRIEAPAYVALAMCFVRWPAIVRLTRESWAGRVALAAGLGGAILFAWGNFRLVSHAWSQELMDYSYPDIRKWFVVAGPAAEFTTMASTLYLNARNSDVVFVALFWAGAAAAIATPRFRLAGLLGVASIVALLIGQVRPCNPITMHRMNVAVALQAVVGGVGAAWLIGLIPVHLSARFARLSQDRGPTLAPTPSPGGRAGAQRSSFGSPPHVALTRIGSCSASPPPGGGRWRKGGSTVLAIIICAIPVWHLAVMERAYTFNVEYALLHEHWPVERAGCRLLYFNGGDADLDYPANIIPGSDPINCAGRDCLADVQAGGCYYLLRGSGCYGRGTAEACRDLMTRAVTRPVAEEAVDFDETFHSSVAVIASHGTVGLYEIFPR